MCVTNALRLHSLENAREKYILALPSIYYFQVNVCKNAENSHAKVVYISKYTSKIMCVERSWRAAYIATFEFKNQYILPSAGSQSATWLHTLYILLAKCKWHFYVLGKCHRPRACVPLSNISSQPASRGEANAPECVH